MTILEEKILKVLNRHGDNQVNLGSSAARQLIANEVVLEIEKTFYPLMIRAVRPLDDTVTIDMEDQFDY